MLKTAAELLRLHARDGACDRSFARPSNRVTETAPREEELPACRTSSRQSWASGLPLSSQEGVGGGAAGVYDGGGLRNRKDSTQGRLSANRSAPDPTSLRRAGGGADTPILGLRGSRRKDSSYNTYTNRMDTARD